MPGAKPKNARLSSPCRMRPPKLPWLFVTQWRTLSSYKNYWFVGSAQSIPESIRALLAKFSASPEQRRSLKEEEYAALDAYFQLRVDKLEHPIRIVYDTIFEDDTVEEALTKIAVAMGADMKSAYPLPCAWTMNDAPLSFDLPDNALHAWKGWHANPLLTNFANSSPSLNAQPAKELKLLNVVHPHKFINVLAYEDYPQPAFAEYHFVHARDLRTDDILKRVRADTDQLAKLWLGASARAPVQNAALVQNDFDRCIVNEWACEATLPSSRQQALVLSEVFDRITTSKSVSFVQWYDDAQHILYKVFDQHTLPEEALTKWTQPASMPSEPAITVYSTLVTYKRSMWSSFVRTVIFASGKVHISCKIHHQAALSWEQVIDSFSAWKPVVTRWLGDPPSLQFKETLVSIQAPYISPALTGRLSQLFQFLSKYSPLLIHPKYEKRPEKAQFEFARSTRRQGQNNSGDLVAFIESQMALEVPESDMVKSIAEREQLSLADAKEVFENAMADMKDTMMSNLAAAPGAGRRDWNKRLLQARMTTQIVCTSYQTSGVLVQIVNALDRHETGRILTWLRGLFGAFIAQAPATPPTQALRVAHLPPPVAASPTPSPAARSQASRTSRETEEEDDYGEDAFAEFAGLVGGEIGRDQMNILDKLRAADPNLFPPSVNYARSCSKTDMRQPVVVTPAQKDYIDRSGYANSYPSALRYGSDSEHQNFYMCPAIWCDTSQVPLTEEQYKANLAAGTKGCPNATEEPWLLQKYRKSTEPYHANLQSIKNVDHLCMPCCGARANAAQLRKNEQCMQRLEPGARAPQASQRRPRSGPSQPTPSRPRSGPSQPTAQPSAQPSARQEENDKDNLLKNKPPLQQGRYGDVPELLYDAMQLRYTDQYQACPKNTSIKKNKQCFVRFGVASPRPSDKPDSFMNALTYLLMGEKATKKDLILLISKSMDPMTFMTLENGLVLLSFLDAEPLIPTDPRNKALVARLTKWLTDPKHKSYITLFGLTDLVSALASSASASASSGIHALSPALQYELSRQLAIFKAFQNFMVHLSWDEPKNTYLMNDLLRLFKARLVIWEKHTNVGGNTSMYMRCPLYTYHDEIDETLRLSYDYIMMLYENGAYDPIELKAKGSPGITKLKANSFPALRELSMQCIRYKEDSTTPVNYSEPRPIETFRLLKRILATVAPDPSIQIETIVLKDDMSILGFMTKNGLFIKAPALHFGALLALLKVLDVKKISYHSDIDRDRMVEMHRGTWELFSERLKTMRYDCPATEILTSPNPNPDPVKIRLNPNIPPVMSAPAIPVRIEAGDPLYRHQMNEAQRTQKWVRIQRKMAAAMVAHYDTWVAPIFAVSEARRAKPIKALHEHLKTALKVSELPAEARVLLEEMPLHDKAALEAYKRTSGMLSKYPFMEFDVKRKSAASGNQWIFSQLAVAHGLPEEVVRPVQGFRPTTAYLQNEKSVTTEVQHPVRDVVRRIALPSMADPSKNTAEDLPSRWTSHAKADTSWKDMKRLEPNAGMYTKESLLDLLAYVGESISIQVSRPILEASMVALVARQLLFAPAFVDKMLEYKSMAHAWRQVYPTQRTSLSEWIKTQPDRVELWKNRVAPMLWPNDVLLYAAAQLMQIYILVIDSRAHDKKTADVKRGSTADHARVSRLFYDADLARHRPKESAERPLLMLYRDPNKDEPPYIDEYQLITYKNEIFFNHLSEAPMDVQHLVSFIRGSS